MHQKLSITAGLILTMILLGVSDAVLVEGLPKNAELAQEDPIIIDTTTPTPTTTSPEGGVRKSTGPDVLTTLISNGFTFADSREKFILSQVLQGGTDILQTKAILVNGDRAGAIGWVESPDVKKYYVVLKEALHSAFTPKVQDLLDETQRRENHPTRNLLTFFDPGILPERIVFVRIQERMYELHIQEGSSDKIFNLLEDLTR